jgi:alkanesulfonate monooxygenase SsuD/methylene tetrahydromethanopterin reductase-like flavin-dependent oxidoreductase (luciferase family)
MKRGLYLAPFDELVDPRLLAELAADAEVAGWDGVFLWDHVAYRPPVRAISDPWVALSAIACATRRLRLGPMVTPLSRRRVHKLARETVSLDQLSGGRLTLGVGLGSDTTGELAPFGEVVDPRQRARLLDTGLSRLAGLWGGEFEPRPLQRPRIPIWVASRWPSRRPLRRAARWDGLFPIELPGPDQLAELADEVRELRAGQDDFDRAGEVRELRAGQDDFDRADEMRELRAGPDDFDLVVEIGAGEDPGPWGQAGATWVLTGFGRQPRASDIRAAINAGVR